MRCFDTATRDHHADEETDLFPALIESMAGSDAACLRDLTASLSRDHRRMEQGWGVLRERLHAVAVPKVEAGDERLLHEHKHPDLQLWGFIETPRGVLQADAICSSGAYNTIAVGTNDLAAELRLPLTPWTDRSRHARRSIGRWPPRPAAAWPASSAPVPPPPPTPATAPPNSS